MRFNSIGTVLGAFRRKKTGLEMGSPKPLRLTKELPMVRLGKVLAIRNVWVSI